MEGQATSALPFFYPAPLEFPKAINPKLKFCYGLPGTESDGAAVVLFITKSIAL